MRQQLAIGNGMELAVDNRLDGRRCFSLTRGRYLLILTTNPHAIARYLTNEQKQYLFGLARFGENGP